MEAVFVYLALAVVISWVTIKEDRLQKGFKPNAKDGDGDGLIQDGTKWERKVKK
jgi:hypothetical protein